MIDIVIPWRATEDRIPLLEHVEAWWHTLGHRIIRAEDSGDGPWVKAHAVTPAVETSRAAIIVVADADCISPGAHDALAAVEHGARWAVPHHYVHRLDETSTLSVLAGADPAAGSCIERPYKGHAGGGIVVMPRAVYLDIPLDPRFQNWGQEDDAWALALTALHGKPWRGQAPLYHLFHQPQPRRSRGIGSNEGLVLYRRYKAARHDPARMRALVSEGRTVAA